MRKFVLIAAIALTAGLVLGGCSKGQEQDQQAAQKTQAATKPTSITDAKGWNAYLGQLVQKNLQGMAAQQPYAYLVPRARPTTTRRRTTASCRTCRMRWPAACCRAT